MVRIRKKIVNHNLVEAEMDESLAFGYSCKLVTVYLKFSVPVTETVQIIFDSGDGEDYDTVIAEEDLDAASSFVFAAPGDIALDEEDKIRVKITNANGVGEVFCTVKVEA